MAEQKAIACIGCSTVFDAYSFGTSFPLCCPTCGEAGSEPMHVEGRSGSWWRDKGVKFAAPAWIEGEPPKNIELAWLRLQYQAGDGEGGFDWEVKVILGTLVPTEHEPEWCEAGDWKGESYRDSIFQWPAFITHWMPYAVPHEGNFGIKDPGTREPAHG